MTRAVVLLLPLLCFLPSTKGVREDLTILHLTDLHFDPWYVVGSDPDQQCHRVASAGQVDSEDVLRKKKAPKRPYTKTTHYYGVAGSICDSPQQLLDATFDFLRRKVAHKVDFVFWTGDSSRHDRDPAFRRGSMEAFVQNSHVVKYFEETFDRDIPIVPSIGNWDTWPQNQLSQGPNNILDKLYETWSPILPPKNTSEGWTLFRDFVKGGYFHRELVPGKMAVISMNTLYWYTDNQEVDDCLDSWEKSRKAGDMHFAWMYEKLSMYRRRNMGVYLVGHVMPVTAENNVNYKPNCFNHYLKMTGDFASTIVGQFDVMTFLMEPVRLPEGEEYKTPNYQLVSLNVNTMDNIDTYKNRIVALMQQSPSIIPAYNPGFKLIYVTVKNSQPESTKRSLGSVETGDADNPIRNISHPVVMTEQTQYYLDLEKANEDHDMKPPGSSDKLYFEGSGCSSRDDFDLKDYTPESLTFWLRKAQRMGARYKGNPIRKYFHCLEIRTSTFQDQIQLDSSTVQVILGSAFILFVVGFYFVYVYMRKDGFSNEYFAEQQKLIG